MYVRLGVAAADDRLLLAAGRGLEPDRPADIRKDGYKMKENKSILDGVPVKENKDLQDLKKNVKPGQIARISEYGNVEWVDPPPGFWDHLNK